MQIQAGHINIPQDCLTAFREQVLITSNKLRTKHNSPNLIHSNQTVTDIAQNYACNLIDNGKFEHRKDLKKLGLGENIYMSSSTDQFSVKPSDCRSIILYLIGYF
jgi:uncharacterized protein YkwD